MWLLVLFGSPALAAGPGQAGPVILAARNSGPAAPAASVPPKLVALTFDDGPHLANTPRILAILRKHQVRATFFVVGQDAAKYPGLIRRELGWGHTVGNHGLTHTVLAGNPVKLRAELAATQAILVKAGARPATLFRPPYGVWDSGTLAGAAALGYSSVLWTVDPQDWSHQMTSASIARSVLSAVRPGAVVLLHDGGGDRWKTVAALPAILQGLKAMGYTPVPLLPGGRLGFPADLARPRPQAASLRMASAPASDSAPVRTRGSLLHDSSGIGNFSTRFSAPRFPAANRSASRWGIGRGSYFSSDITFEPARLSYTFQGDRISTLIAGCLKEDCVYRGRLTIYEGSAPAHPRSVLYWMERSQRAEDNPALRYAVERANRLRLPLVAYYALDEAAPHAGARTMTFVLQGLKETAGQLRSQGVHFALRPEPAVPGLFRMVKEAGAAEVVGDQNYVGVTRLWREEAAKNLSVPFVLVDSDVAVPVREIGREQESWERMRPRFRTLLAEHLTEAAEARPEVSAAGGLPEGVDLQRALVDDLVSALKVDREAKPVRYYIGGAGEAAVRLRAFLAGNLEESSPRAGSSPLLDAGGLNPYLRWGHLSPVRVALEATRPGMASEARSAFAVEAVGRRELAWNYAFHRGVCESRQALPEWGRESLTRHTSDFRPVIYDPETLERAQTCDELWNAAQKELLSTGAIHDCLRGYWAKKLLEWTPSPEEAHRLGLDLYGKYALDAGDPTAYAGIASATGGLYDSPAEERPIYGLVPEPSSEALWRKMDIGAYIGWVKDRCREMDIGTRLVWPEEAVPGA